MHDRRFPPAQALGALVLTLGATALHADAMTSDPGDGEIRYDRDIRPLLSDRCFRCHGPDPSERRADLRLDTFDHATAERAGAPAIVPGDAQESELYRRVASDDPDDRMPPAASHKAALSAEELARVRRWIDGGAVYEEHWSFVPPERPPVPSVAGAEWPRDPLDAFVLKELERHGIAPSPRRRSGDAAATRVPRPDRSAPDTGGARRVLRRRASRRLRASGRTPAVRAPLRRPLRRAHGGALARRRALRRHVRHPHGRGTADLGLARLGPARVPRRPAVRSLPDRAAGRRSDAGRDPQPEDRQRLQPQSRDDRRGRRDRGGVSGRVRRRPHVDDRSGLLGSDAGLRALSRPQVRSRQPDRVLRAVRVLQLDRGAGALLAATGREPGLRTVPDRRVGRGQRGARCAREGARERTDGARDAARGRGGRARGVLRGAARRRRARLGRRGHGGGALGARRDADARRGRRRHGERREPGRRRARDRARDRRDGAPARRARGADGGRCGRRSRRTRLERQRGARVDPRRGDLAGRPVRAAGHRPHLGLGRRRAEERRLPRRQRAA